MSQSGLGVGLQFLAWAECHSGERGCLAGPVMEPWLCFPAAAANRLKLLCLVKSSSGGPGVAVFLSLPCSCCPDSPFALQIKNQAKYFWGAERRAECYL